jgi:16S rRNA (guanine527-N7)-methyltransferase
MAHKNKSNISPYKTRQQARQKNTNPSSEQGPAQGSLKGKHKRPETVYSINEANDRMRDIFANHSFEHVTHAQRLKLAEFYHLLMTTQENENFTRLLKLRDVAIRHFIDCLIVADLTKLKFPLMDVGTGPGFPGIPLKIKYPDEEIILAEGVQRRVEFLKRVRSELDLKNLAILGRNINPTCMYPVNGVITRAVEDIGNTLSNVLYSLQTGGRVYFMKGPNVDPEIPDALTRMGEFYKLAEDKAYTLPHTSHERRLLVFEKIKAPPLADLDKILEDESNADKGWND